jgi:hypothetical protein
MGFTYNLATTIGRSRLLIPDRIPESAIFSDEELGGFLNVEGDDPRLVAAAALETMAASDAYLFKKNKVEDLQTDGPAVANALMKRAQALREQAELEDAKGGGAFDWAEQVLDPFTARERLINQALRGVV